MKSYNICRECGEKLEITDAYYRKIDDGDRLTPPDYMLVWEEETCPGCGEVYIETFNNK